MGVGVGLEACQPQLEMLLPQLQGLHQAAPLGPVAEGAEAIQAVMNSGQMREKEDMFNFPSDPRLILQLHAVGVFVVACGLENCNTFHRAIHSEL